MLGTRPQIEDSRNTLAKGVKKSTKRVRGKKIDSTTLCTPFEKTFMIVHPGKQGNIPRPRWGKKDEKSKKGESGANDRDKTCSKNWDTKKQINSTPGLVPWFAIGDDLGPWSRQFSPLGFFLIFYGGCILADQSPPSSRVDFFSASSICRVNYN